MRREQGLLLATVAVLALLGWRLLAPGSRPARGRPAALPLELEELAPADPVVELAAGPPERDPLRARRDTEPLPPLDLPLPDVPELPVLLPPPLPDSGPDHWSDHLLLFPRRLAGDLEEVLEPGSGAEEPAAADSAAGGDVGGTAQEGGGEYTSAYDSVRIDAFTVLYGRILNENRYDLKEGDPIHFQEVDVRTGRDRYAPRVLEPGRYQSFRLAETLRNRIELDVRAVPLNAGNVLRIRELVSWLLEQGAQEPAALAHAERLARKTVELAPDDLASWMALGEVFERTFRWDEALALYSRLAGQRIPGTPPDPVLSVPEGRFARSSAPRVHIAALLRQLGLDAEAEAVLGDALALQDGNPAAPLELGILLLQTGRAAQAQPLLERARSLQTGRGSALALRNLNALGWGHLALGDWDAAGRAFESAGRAAVPRGDGAAEFRDARAGSIAALYLAGDFAAAAEGAAAAVAELGPEAGLLYLRGISAAAAGAPAGEVVRDLRAAVAAAPLDAASALEALAFWLDVQGRSDLAAEALGQALEISPQSFYGRYLWALFARRAGDGAAAREELRALVGAAPGCAATLAELGWLLHDGGLYDAAEVALRRAEQAQPSLTPLVLRRGLNLLRLGHLEAARGALRRALALDHGLHAARNALAWAAYAEGDLSGALAEFGDLQDALRAEPEHPQRLYAELWSQRIRAHSQLQVWRDSFEGRLMRPQWDVMSEARVGVEPRLQDGALRIQGQHSGQGKTRAFRTVRALDFRSFAGDLTAGAEHRGEAGVYLALRTRGQAQRETWLFEVYRDREGVLRWRLQQGGAEAEGDSFSRQVPADVPLRVAFTLDREPAPPILSVTLDGERVWSRPMAALRSPAGDLAVGAFGQTSVPVPVDVRLDNVELVFSQGQG